jgi:hypothetical protein
MNVSISRAKCKCILILSEELLFFPPELIYHETIAEDFVYFMNLISYLQDNAKVYSESILDTNCTIYEI